MSKIERRRYLRVVLGLALAAGFFSASRGLHTAPERQRIEVQTDRFMWVRPDFLIFFAAGNQGPAPLTVGNPATAKNIVTVGATENGDGEPKNMADFSSHGPIPPSGPPGGGNRLSPTIGAPGVGLLSALFGA